MSEITRKDHFTVTLTATEIYDLLWQSSHPEATVETDEFVATITLDTDSFEDQQTREIINALVNKL